MDAGDASNVTLPPYSGSMEAASTFETSATSSTPARYNNPRTESTSLIKNPSSSYMALQPISGLGLLFMRFRNFTLIDGW
jgi:hypothetical protein